LEYGKKLSELANSMNISEQERLKNKQ